MLKIVLTGGEWWMSLFHFVKVCMIFCKFFDSENYFNHFTHTFKNFFIIIQTFNPMFSKDSLISKIFISYFSRLFLPYFHCFLAFLPFVLPASRLRFRVTFPRNLIKCLTAKRLLAKNGIQSVELANEEAPRNAQTIWPKRIPLYFILATKGSKSKINKLGRPG